MSLTKIIGNSPKYYIAAILPAVGMYIGWFFDRKETERMVRFRDKSALYGRELKPGEKPTWP